MALNYKLKILAISGSLKSSSSNTNILKALSRFKTETVDFTIFNGLDEFPHFNPEKEEGNDAVKNFRQHLKIADGIIICTPEYAFGVPGTLKNALDWVVSSGELNEKPAIAISASPMYEGGLKAMTSLRLTLSALGTLMNEKSHLSIPNILNKINSNAEILDAQLNNDLKAIFEHLLSVIDSTKLERP